MDLVQILINPNLFLYFFSNLVAERCASIFLDLGIDPVSKFGNFGVDAKHPVRSTAISPADNSDEVVLVRFIALHSERSTTVALTAVLARSASAEHLLRDPAFVGRRIGYALGRVGRVGHCH